MFNVSQLRAVCAVVREGSFAGAARRLGYTASAVSQQVSGLERGVGVVLFEREASGIRATPAARYMAIHGEELLMRLDDFDRQLSLLAGGEHGHLRFGSFPTANRRIFPDVLARFLHDHPDADVELDEGNTNDVIAGVVDGSLDLGIVHMYTLVPEEWPPGLTTLELMTEDLLLLLPSNHPLAGAGDFRFENLKTDRWISTQEETVSARCVRRICAAHGFLPNVAFRSNDYDVVQGLVRTGAGVAVVPELGYTHNPGIYAHRLSEWTPGRKLLAVHRAGNSNPLLSVGVDCWQSACSQYQAKLVRNI